MSKSKLVLEELLPHLKTWIESIIADKDKRGFRAELRRAKTPQDVFTSRAFLCGLVPELREKGFNLAQWELERLALPVGVLSHVKSGRLVSQEEHFAKLLRKSKKRETDKYDVRFRRLLSINDDDRDALYLMLVRLVRYLDGTAELKSLVEGGYWWNDYTRRDWAYNYYSVN